MLPHVSREPGAAGGSVTLRAVNRGGGAPQVCIVEIGPSAGVEHHLRGLAPAHRDVLDQREQRLGAFSEIRRFRGPVVHLGVDVDRVFAVPGWLG